MGVKVCEGCPDRFLGCVQLDKDQTLPVINETGNYEDDLASLHQQYKIDGWRKVKVKHVK